MEVKIDEVNINELAKRELRYRYCSYGKHDVLADTFGKSKGSKDDIYPICKDCVKVKNAKHYSKKAKAKYNKILETLNKYEGKELAMKDRFFKKLLIKYQLVPVDDEVNENEVKENI